MATRKRPTLVAHLKDWWWAYGVGSTLCGVIILWGGMPTRMAKAEQKNEQQDVALDDLKGWAREIQGYTKAQQQANLMQQQAPAPPPIRLLWDEQAHRAYCDDGTTQWWLQEENGCD